MPIQDYNIYTGNAYKGQESDASSPRVNGSGFAEAATGFGLALTRGTAEGQVLVGHDSGNVFGISIREMNHEAVNRPSDGETAYAINQSVSLMREGYINVLVNDHAAVAGAFAAVNDTTGEFVGGTADTGETQSTNVVFMEAGIAGSIVRARIDIK